MIGLLRPFIRSQDELDDPELIAEIISLEAEKLSSNPGHNSPFAVEARAKFYDYYGGKVDDITVVVAQVKIDKEN